MDLNESLGKLSVGDKTMGISAGLLFIFSFMPWYGLGSGSRNGWHYFLFGVIPVLLALAILVALGIEKFTDTKLPDLPVSWAQAYLIAAGLAAFLIFLRLVLSDKVSAGFGSISIHATLDRKYGLILSFLAVIGLVVGAVLKLREPAGEASPPAI